MVNIFHNNVVIHLTIWIFVITIYSDDDLWMVKYNFFRKIKSIFFLKLKMIKLLLINRYNEDIYPRKHL